jgi:predicted ATPase
MGAMATLTPAPRLRGREQELQALGASDQVASGHPAVVIVEGEAGIGKTRLLAEALDGARSRGLQVAAGRALELEQTHLAHVFAKLGISSRTQLAAEAARQAAPSRS